MCRACTRLNYPWRQPTNQRVASSVRLGQWGRGVASSPIHLAHLQALYHMVSILSGWAPSKLCKIKPFRAPARQTGNDCPDPNHIIYTRIPPVYILAYARRFMCDFAGHAAGQHIIRMQSTRVAIQTCIWQDHKQHESRMEISCATSLNQNHLKLGRCNAYNACWGLLISNSSINSSMAT